MLSKEVRTHKSFRLSCCFFRQKLWLDLVDANKMEQNQLKNNQIRSSQSQPTHAIWLIGLVNSEFRVIILSFINLSPRRGVYYVL